MYFDLRNRKYMVSISIDQKTDEVLLQLGESNRSKGVRLLAAAWAKSNPKGFVDPNVGELDRDGNQTLPSDLKEEMQNVETDDDFIEDTLDDT